MNVWVAAVSMLSTTIYCFSPSGVTFKWLRHSPRVASNRMVEEESIYITNINSHFEIVSNFTVNLSFCIYMFYGKIIFMILKQ